MALETLASPLDKYKGTGIGNSDETKKTNLPRIKGLKELYESLEELDFKAARCLPLEATIELVRQTYTPKTLDMVIQTLPALRLSYQVCGVTISKLIHNSHKAGYNDFTIHLHKFETPVHDIGHNLTSKKQVNITIHGDVAGAFLYHATNVIATLYGDIKKGTYVLQGAENVTVDIKDKKAKLSKVDTYGKNSTIILHDIEQYRKLIKTRFEQIKKHKVLGDKKFKNETIGDVTFLYEKDGKYVKAEL